MQTLPSTHLPASYLCVVNGDLYKSTWKNSLNCPMHASLVPFRSVNSIKATYNSDPQVCWPSLTMLLPQGLVNLNPQIFWFIAVCKWWSGSIHLCRECQSNYPGEKTKPVHFSNYNALCENEFTINRFLKYTTCLLAEWLRSWTIFWVSLCSFIIYLVYV